jgi:hypothetical protein
VGGYKGGNKFKNNDLDPPVTGRVVVVRGDRCETSTDMFRGFSAALQFPLYFGWKWAAFSDSLNDNRVVSRESVVLVITQVASALNKESPQEQGWLCEELVGLAFEPETREPGELYATVVLVDTEANLTAWHEQLPTGGG